MNYVIIGNGSAAAGVVEGIRTIDKDLSNKITVISSESHHIYSRPLISYLLLGKTDLERMKYRPDDFYAKNGCTLLAGKTVVKINTDSKTVLLDDGNKLEYDRLCVATGSRPFVPPFNGLDNVKNKFAFMTLDDALSIEKVVDKNSRVFIVGAGLIGLKCAEGLHKRVGSITVADLSPLVLSSILEENTSIMVRKHLEGKGINFLLGDTVDVFEENAAVMKSGKRVEFDILVLAVGVKPNTSLVAECGGNVNRGIATDKKMKTTVDDIYAAGDCTETFDISLGQSRILALLPNAYMQGEVAGINMAEGNADFENAVPMNAISLMGIEIATAGSYLGHVVEDSSDGIYRRFYTSDNLLKGYIIIGKPSKTGIYTYLIRNKVPLDTIDFDTLIKNPCLNALGENHTKCLESVV
jgi:NAD(P)H-nitrite reductase large subunit